MVIIYICGDVMVMQSVKPRNSDSPARVAQQAFTPQLATGLQALFRQYRPQFNDILLLNKPPPAVALTLDEWRKPAIFTSLLSAFSDHAYRHYPYQQPNQGLLKTLWLQWYTGMLIPPLMMSLLLEKRAPSLNPGLIRAQFNENGRLSRLWMHTIQDVHLTRLSPVGRMQALISEVLLPIIKPVFPTDSADRTRALGNSGYLINSFLDELHGLINQQQLAEIRHGCFLEEYGHDGRANPLFGTLRLQHGQLIRSHCCQQYQLPNTSACHGCVKNKA